MRETREAENSRSHHANTDRHTHTRTQVQGCTRSLKCLLVTIPSLERQVAITRDQEATSERCTR